MIFLRVALTAIVLVTLITSSPNAAPDFSSWSAPVNVGPIINSTFAEAGPAISKDGLSLYFHSDRPGGEGSTDFWVSQRASQDAPWGAPVHLGDVINTPNTEAVAALSRDEHWLFFTSDRPGGFGGNDIWASYRQHTHDPLDWQPAVNLGADVNSAFIDSAPSYFANDDGGAPQLFFHSSRPGGIGGTDIYVSELFPNGTFGPASLVVELSNPGVEQHPSIRFDGLEIFFFSDRPVSVGAVDLWAATRRTVLDPWSTPTNLGPLVNSIFGDVQPYISSDRRTLYFQAARPGGFGSQDIWMTTRSKH
jgi:WD40 repeat protein